MAKMIFAKKKDTGTIVSIDEVDSGLTCNCVCPHCGARLEARKGKKRIHHFKHSVDNTETSFCSESALHLAAKEVLKEERKMALPGLTIGDNIYKRSFEVLPDKYEFHYDIVEVEKSIYVDEAVIRPDVIVSNGKETLAIEILVSHAVDEEKQEKIRQARLTTIEIDLNSFDITSKETLKRVLVTETSNKKWIFSNKAIYFEKKILEYCEKFIVRNRFVKDCPLKIWQEKKLGAFIEQCNGCKYGYEVNLGYVLCLGVNRISDIKDLKLKSKDFEEHIRNEKIKELENDKVNFSKGICPICNSKLRITNVNDSYISCSNYNECKFTAVIDLTKYTSCFKNRKGEKIVVDLPEFVLNGVLQLQKRAKEEVEDIDKLFEIGLCPYCANDLIIRESKYGVFLGCKGYMEFGCKFKPKIDFKNMTATFQTRHSPKRTIIKAIPNKIIEEYKKWKHTPRRSFLLSDEELSKKESKETMDNVVCKEQSYHTDSNEDVRTNQAVKRDSEYYKNLGKSHYQEKFKGKT